MARPGFASPLAILADWARADAASRDPAALDARIRPFERCFAAPARCSRAISGCRPVCTAPATCSARSSSSTRVTPRRIGAGAGRAGPVASAPPPSCRPRSAASSSARKSARALDVRALFAERQDGTLTLRRGFTLVARRQRAGRRRRGHDRRLHARDDGGGARSRRRGRRRLRDRRSQRRPPRPRRAVRRAAADAICRPTPEAECPLCQAGRSRHQARIAHDQRIAALDRELPSQAVSMLAHAQADDRVRRHRVRRLAAAGDRADGAGGDRRCAPADRRRPRRRASAPGAPTPACMPPDRSPASR